MPREPAPRAPEPPPAGDGGAAPPTLSLGALLARFLGFGARAWGGPVAQLAMLKHELVEQERWVSPERFHRALAVYQVLPGPEAHEMCVWFGMLARGRAGALVAGLGFLLPGLLLVLALAWAYVRFGGTSPALAGPLAGLQVAVVALVVRAVPRMAHHAVTAQTWPLALAALLLGLTADVPFYVPLVLGAVAGPLLQQRSPLGLALLVLVAGGALAWRGLPAWSSDPVLTDLAGHEAPSLLALARSGLEAGLLTFGGAYTAIPLVGQHAARWMPASTFLDGLGLSSVLPAPLIIFATFVGYVAGGLPGALVMTAGVFLPAFGFTLIGHEVFERLVQHRGLRAALDGVSTAVVGLIAATAVRLALREVRSLPALLLAAAVLATLLAWRSRWAVPLTMLAAGAAGWLLALST